MKTCSVAAKRLAPAATLSQLASGLPVRRACAFALLGCSMIEEVVEGAESFARALHAADQVLSPASAHTASLLLMPPATAWSH